MSIFATSVLILKCNVTFAKLWNGQKRFCWVSKTVLIFTHSFIIHNCLSLCRVVGGLEPIPADTGRGRGSPWTRRQFITGLTCSHNHSSSHLHLQTVINSPAYLWTVGGRQSTYRENIHREDLPQLGIEPRTFCLWGNSANHRPRAVHRHAG